MNTTETAPSPKVHHGRNIKRLREMLGVKQEYMASELNLTQQSISKLEQKEVIEDEMLEKVAKVLKVPVEAIKNLNDEATFNIIANSYHDNASSVNYRCTFNPIDKLVELYERLLTAEKDKVAMMEKLLEEKK
ncbi:transcriptional regulator [Prolixibacter bellariivorans]|uniref:Transcriptional regulator n=1 Tax=Prolixibacter bellariivorans TaxID=314319 RepID=A0A5M4B3H1_9BACT|nr:helix-turn-helix transcriptional regulator [Prolixibacter bellariivorans]GET34644.1 transcriptional regulator [Prolixibacter bellariivorans]